MTKPSVIAWPTVQIGARVFTLKFAYTAMYQLRRWNRDIATATALELSAAMACEPGPDLKLRSSAFDTPFDLAALIEEEIEKGGTVPDLMGPNAEALKKAYPELTI